MTRCLIVDDSPADRSDIEALLSAYGFDLRSLDNAEAALDQCRAAMPDVVLVSGRIASREAMAFIKRLRRKPGAEEFAHAWDMALAIHAQRTGKTVNLPRTPLPRKVTPAPTWRMICDGQWQAVLRRGKYAGSYPKPDNSALLRYIDQIDRSFRNGQKELRRELRSQAEKG